MAEAAHNYTEGEHGLDPASREPFRNAVRGLMEPGPKVVDIRKYRGSRPATAPLPNGANGEVIDITSAEFREALGKADKELAERVSKALSRLEKKSPIAAERVRQKGRSYIKLLAAGGLTAVTAAGVVLLGDLPGASTLTSFLGHLGVPADIIQQGEALVAGAADTVAQAGKEVAASTAQALDTAATEIAKAGTVVQEFGSAAVDRVQGLVGQAHQAIDPAGHVAGTGGIPDHLDGRGQTWSA